MAELPGKKTKNRLLVKVVWNKDEHGDLCQKCMDRVINYCQEIGLDELPEYNMSYFLIPFIFYHASEKLGCEHGRQKVIKSYYEGIGENGEIRGPQLSNIETQK